jgi:hypothetical protein
MEGNDLENINIITDIWIIGCVCGIWIDLDQNRTQWLIQWGQTGSDTGSSK